MIQRFNHTERRFLIPYLYQAIVEEELGRALPPGGVYHVETTYVDTPERSWSLMSDSSLPKMRVRTYDGSDTYYEKKLHVDSDTEKERVPVDGMPEGLTSVGTTEYLRTEHQLNSARVTVDRNVLMDGVRFDMLIVEVKGEMPKELSFLKPFENKKFSKYKALSGRWKKEHA